MNDGVQGEFLFVDGWKPLEGADSGAATQPATLDEEIAAVWGVPVGRRASVRLKHHELPGLEGYVEVSAVPDFPFDSHKVLRLRIGFIEFTNRQIESWTIPDRPA